jgi:heme-degrading monooxygenase HmoA
MLARVARYEVSSDRINDAVAAFGDAAKEIEELEGFAGGYVLVDHEDGRTMTLTLWDNHAALENSERSAGKLRRQAASSVGGTVLSVEKFEVAQELTVRQSRI